MATNYPAGLDTFPDAATLAGEDLDTSPHSTLHGNLGDALEAVEGELGTDPAGSDATVVARLDRIDGGPDFSNTDNLGLPGGTTAQRPGTPTEGDLRKNTTTNVIEYYDGSGWVDLTDTAPSGAAGGDLGGTYPNPTVDDGADSTAIHDDTAGEIAAITAKATPTTSDLAVIEDAAAANAKKRITLGSIDIAGDVTGDLSATVVGDDSHAHTGTTVSALDTGDVTTGTFADARIAQSNVTQHQGAIDHGSIAGLTDDDHTGYARLAGRSGGQTLIGGTGSGDDLVLESTSNATKGTLFLDEEIVQYDGDRTFTASPALFDLGGGSSRTLTLNATDQFGSTSALWGLRMIPTVVFDQPGSVFGSVFLFDCAFTAQNADTEDNDLGLVLGFVSRFTLQASTTSGSVSPGSNVQEFRSNATAKVAGAGGTETLAVTGWSSFISTPGVDTNATVTTLRQFYAANLADTDGTITTRVGVDIVKEAGATTDLGLRNAATTVFTPTTQAITAAGNTITPNATYKNLNPSSGSVTLTSNPSISDGTEGQLLILENRHASNTITLTDSTNGMQMAGSITLGQYDTITFVYNGTDWVEISRSNN